MFYLIKSCFILFISLSFFTPGYTQDSLLKTHNFYFLGSIKDVGIGYMKLKQNAGWGIKLGYSYALDNEKTYNGGLSSKDFDLTRFINMKGPGLEIYISGVSQKGNINTIALHYNHLSSGTYIYSHGYSGGPVSIEYAKYTEEYSIIGLKYTFMKRVEDSFFFIAFGIEGRDITRTYSEEGSVDYISPSNRVEKLFKLPLTHEFGLILVFPK